MTLPSASTWLLFAGLVVLSLAAGPVVRWWIRRRIRMVGWDRPVTAEIAAAALDLPAKTSRRIAAIRRRGAFGLPLHEHSPADREAMLALIARVKIRGNVSAEAIEREFPGGDRDV